MHLHHTSRTAHSTLAHGFPFMFHVTVADAAAGEQLRVRYGGANSLEPTRGRAKAWCLRMRAERSLFFILNHSRLVVRVFQSLRLGIDREKIPKPRSPDADAS